MFCCGAFSCSFRFLGKIEIDKMFQVKRNFRVIDMQSLSVSFPSVVIYNSYCLLRIRVFPFVECQVSS